ncbi:MAG: GYD domain-containing protein [Bacteroidota bacterium]
MPTYITLLNWTQKGIENVKDAPKRLEGAKKLYKAAGAEIKAFYLVLGQYDAVVLSEAPNDETAARIALSVGRQGNVRTQTMRAFAESEYRKLVGSLK